MNKDNGNQVEMSYQISTNTLYIMAPESAFDKNYLKYLLEHLGIPANATLMFITLEEPHDNI